MGFRSPNPAITAHSAPPRVDHPSRRRDPRHCAPPAGRAILAVIVASVLATGRTEYRLAQHREDIAELGAIADGALNIAILRLLDPSLSAQPPVDATPFTLSFAGRQLRVTVQDEAGEIDLNMAGHDLLVRLLIWAGLDLMAAQRLADRILDWREPGIGTRLNGAKAPEYRAAGYAYGPRGGPFAAVEELKLVMGVTRDYSIGSPRR
jgi:general secretion pathway protein K